MITFGMNSGLQTLLRPVERLKAYWIHCGQLDFMFGTNHTQTISKAVDYTLCVCFPQHVYRGPWEYLTLCLCLGPCFACVLMCVCASGSLQGHACLRIGRSSNYQHVWGKLWLSHFSLEINRISQRYPSPLIYLNLTLNFSLWALPAFSFVHLILPSPKPKENPKRNNVLEKECRLPFVFPSLSPKHGTPVSLVSRTRKQKPSGKSLCSGWEVNRGIWVRWDDFLSDVSMDVMQLCSTRL